MKQIVRHPILPRGDAPVSGQIQQQSDGPPGILRHHAPRPHIVLRFALPSLLPGGVCKKGLITGFVRSLCERVKAGSRRQAHRQNAPHAAGQADPFQKTGIALAFLSSSQRGRQRLTAVIAKLRRRIAACRQDPLQFAPLKGRIARADGQQPRPRRALPRQHFVEDRPRPVNVRLPAGNISLPALLRRRVSKGPQKPQRCVRLSFPAASRRAEIDQNGPFARRENNILRLQIQVADGGLHTVHSCQNTAHPHGNADRLPAGQALLISQVFPQAFPPDVLHHIAADLPVLPVNEFVKRRNPGNPFL